MFDLLKNSRYKGPAIPDLRPQKPKLEPQTEVAVLLRKLKKDHGLIPAEIQRLLGEKLNMPISHTRLYGWFSGREPRVRRQDVVAALKKIAKEHPVVGTAWVMPAEVRADVEAWLLLLSEAALARVTKASEFTIKAWSQGKHRVRKQRWAEIREKVAAELKKRAARKASR